MSDRPAPLGHSAAAAATRFGCSRSMIYIMAARGDIEMKKLGSRTLITDESLCRYFASLPPADIRPAASR